MLYKKSYESIFNIEESKKDKETEIKMNWKKEKKRKERVCKSFLFGNYFFK